MINKETLDLFRNKLDLDAMPADVIGDFLASMTFYLNHGRKNDGLKGRTTEFLSDKLDKVVHFYTSFDNVEIVDVVKVITNFPQILNIADVLYDKYLLLGVLENEENTLRREKFFSRPKDLMIGLSTMYSRYKIICLSGLNNFTWNNMVHSSDREFAKMFTKGVYKKSYQIFESMEQVQAFINNDEFDLDVEEYKSLDVNKEFVEKYEKREFRM